MPDSTKPEAKVPDPSLIRLNKAIADSGYCARRKADELIAQGRVTVNGQLVSSLGCKVNTQTDIIAIDGRPLTQIAKAYLLLHKPVGYVTSRQGGQRQKTIYQLIPSHYQAVDPAGRLDQDSSGALILSNDGDFLYRITHPKFHWPKHYRIQLDRPLTPADIEQLQAGILLKPENKLARMTNILRLADPTRGHASPPTYEVELLTGYNRQIRRSFLAVGYRVQALHRHQFGPILLTEDLVPGAIRPLSSQEQAQLLRSE